MMLLVTFSFVVCFQISIGGNEYGQCGEEPERKNEGALKRDIVIPQCCVPHLSVCQVISLNRTMVNLFYLFQFLLREFR